MRELRVLTLHVDRHTGLFDDRPLRGYLRDREVLAAQPQFFVHDGRPCWSIFLDTRLLQGAAERGAGGGPGPAAGPAHGGPPGGGAGGGGGGGGGVAGAGAGPRQG